MRPSPEWMGLEVTDDHFFEWIDYLVQNTNIPELEDDLISARQSTETAGDQPPGFGYYTPEEDSIMWNLYKEWCAPRNAEAKEYFYQQTWVLMLTPEAYQQLKENNPGVEDPAQWVDGHGNPWMEYFQREFRFMKQNYSATGFSLRSEVILKLFVIEDPLADSIDQPENSNIKINEVLRDSFFFPSLQDPNSSLSLQIKQIADLYGTINPQMIIISRHGQSGGETYYHHSNDPQTNGQVRGFGGKLSAMLGFDFYMQIPGLLAAEQLKSTLRASNSTTNSGGKRSWNKPVPEIRAEQGIPENWWPVGAQGQSDEDNALLFKHIQFGNVIISAAENNAGGGRLLTPSNPDTTVNILWQEWDEQTQKYIGEKVSYPIPPGADFNNVVKMTHLPHQLLMGNVSREVGLIPQTLSVNMNPEIPTPSDITAEIVEGGYNITVPGNFLLAEANPEITSFLINSQALPDGIQLVSQNGAEATFFIPTEIAIQLPSSALNIVVHGFSVDDDRLCTPSTTMQLNLLELPTFPPEANSESLDIPYQQNLSIDTIISNDQGAVDIQIVEGSLPNFAMREGDTIVFDWDYILSTQTNPVLLKYYTVNEGGILSDTTAIATLTFEEIPPGANSESRDIPYENTLAIDTLISNDPKAVDIRIVEESLPSFAVRQDNVIAFNWAHLVANKIGKSEFEYYTIDEEGVLSETTATVALTFKDENGNTISIEEIQNQDQPINIHPNPSNGPIIIDGIENSQYEAVRCQLFDITGQLIHDEITGNTSENSISPDIEKGMYILKIFVGSRLVKIEKIVRR